MQTFEAVIDQNGSVELLEPVELSGKYRALVTVLDYAIETELRPYGLCEGDFVVPDDFDEPLPENILQDFEGA